jgi:hypothetical protein
MRRDQTFTRILLLFSIANVVLAAPAFVIQRSPVTDGPESTEGSVPSLVSDSDASQSLAGLGVVSQAPPPLQVGSEHGSPAGSVHQDFVPESSGSGAQQLNDPPSTPGAQPLHSDSLPASEGLPLQGDSLPAPEAAQLHNIPPSASGAAQLHDSPSGPGAAPSHDDLPSGSGAQPLHEDPHASWQNYRPVTEIEEAPSSRLESSHLHSDALEAPRVSGASLESGWSEAFAVAAEAEAKEAEDKVKPPKGLCGLRCWMQFYI